MLRLAFFFKNTGWDILVNFYFGFIATSVLIVPVPLLPLTFSLRSYITFSSRRCTTCRVFYFLCIAMVVTAAGVTGDVITGHVIYLVVVTWKQGGKVGARSAILNGKCTTF